MSTLTRKGLLFALLLSVCSGEDDMSLIRTLTSSTATDVQGGQSATLFRGQTQDSSAASYTITISCEGLMVGPEEKTPAYDNASGMDRIVITHGFQNARRTVEVDLPNSITFTVHGSFLQIDAYNGYNKARKFKVLIGEGVSTVTTPLTKTVRSGLTLNPGASNAGPAAIPEGAYAFTIYRYPRTVPLVIDTTIALFAGNPAEPIRYQFDVAAGENGKSFRIIPGVSEIRIENAGIDPIPRGNLMTVFDVVI